MINLLECLSIKFKKINKSCSFSKAARISSIKFAFVKDYTNLAVYIRKNSWKYLQGQEPRDNP